MRIPHVLDEILSEYKSRDKNAIIAGGCIRDLRFGVPFKDIDIFTTKPSPIEIVAPPEMDYEGMQYVIGVREYTYDGYKINEIIIEPIDKIKLLESFDWGLCQICYDGNTITTTQAFLWDEKHGTITLRQLSRYSRSLKRYARFSQRYIDHNFTPIIPELETLNAKSV